MRLLSADIEAAGRRDRRAAAQGRGPVADRRSDGDGFVSGGDDGRLLRIAPDGSATEIANQKGKWIDKLAAHRATGAIAASVGKMALVVDKAGEVREFGPHQSTVAGARLQQGRQPHRRRAL